MTNKEFSKTDAKFIEACKKVGLPKHVAIIHEKGSTHKGATYESLARQAGKWRKQKGIAYKEGRLL